MTITVRVLGTAQDAGVPHFDCTCGMCERARTNPTDKRYAAALSIEDENEEYLLDATPDIRFQLSTVPDGVFLSHAHLGHLPGLLHVGMEGANTTGLPVYCTDGMTDVICENAPFNLLVDRNHLDLRTISDGERIHTETGAVTVQRVIHREALPTGTLSFVIDGEERSLYYVSDIDKWTDSALTTVREADIALVDGTFWSRNELDRIEDVPHPFMRETMNRLKGDNVYFTHLNHTNPTIRVDSDERRELEDRGFSIVERGMTFEL